MFEFLYRWLEELKIYLFNRVSNQIYTISEGPRLEFSSLYDPTLPLDNYLESINSSDDDVDIVDIYDQDDEDSIYLRL